MSETARRSLPQLCLERPIGTLAVMAALLAVGIIALLRLPVSLMPEIVYPLVRVQVSAGQTPPEVLAQTVTRILEQQLSQAEAIETIESTTRQGLVQITLSFDQKRNVDDALRDVSTQVDRVKARLPADVDPPIIFKFDPQNLPVIEFALSADRIDPIALRQLADNDLSYRFVGVPGVAVVRVAGGKPREIQVRVDPVRLRSHGLVLADVANALRAANIQVAAGRIDAAGQEFSGQVISLFGNAREVGNVRLMAPNRDAVRLQDVAEVVDTHREQRLIVNINGKESIKLSVFKSPQANSVEVAQAVRTRLDELQKQHVIPEEVAVAVTSDESVYIDQSIQNAQHALFLAMSLVALVVLLFLRDWRFAVIVLSVLPVALLATALLMKAFGLSLNLMSIGGLILGVGLLVDYGIVLLENITRHTATGKSVREAVAEGAQEVTQALTASLAALTAAVLPFLFLGGLALLFFKEFIVTIIFATVGGLVAALALIPALYPLIVRSTAHGHIEQGTAYYAVLEYYERLLDVCLRHGRWVIAGAVSLLLVAVFAMSQLGYLFLPEIDDGKVSISVQGEPGTLLTSLQAQVQRIEEAALAEPEVELVDVSTGGRIGQTIQETPAGADIQLQLVPKAARNVSVQQWIASFDKKVKALQMAGLKVRVKKARIRAIRTFKGQAATGDFDVVVNIEGQDTAVLADLADKVREQLRSVSGLTDLTSTLITNQPLVNVAVNRERAATFGISPQTIAQAVQTAINGAIPTRMLDSGFYYDIRLMNNRQAVYGHLLDLPTLPLRRLENGDLLLLGQVADIQIRKGPLAIDRVNQATVNMVNGTVRGRTLGEVAPEVKQSLAALELPPGYTLSYGGRMATLSEGGSGLLWIGGLALFLILIVLAVQYESLVNPLIVVGVLPMGLVGAAVALLLTQTPISATVFIGLVLMVGIAANNSIVLVAYVEQLRELGHSLAEAVRMGAATRLRPILMTATAAIAGMVPLATGGQEGGEILQPLAITVIGGMTASLVATLFVLPAIYSAIHQRRAARPLPLATP